MVSNIRSVFATTSFDLPNYSGRIFILLATSVEDELGNTLYHIDEMNAGYWKLHFSVVEADSPNNEMCH